MFRTSALFAGMAVGLAAAIGLAVPAFAGGIDYGVGTVHRVPAAVPVPAPAPVPDYASGYYMRLDAAYGFNDTDKYNALAPNDSDPIRGENSLDQFGRYGLGVGYHFSRMLRMDVTLDTRSEVKSQGGGNVDYTATFAGLPTTMRDTFSDSFRTRNYTGLLNGYVDLAGWSHVTPYVGAGIGLAVHTLSGRAFGRGTTCTDPVPANCAAATTAGAVTTVTGSSSSKNDIALAAAFMTGVNFKVARNGSIDLGYRLLYLQGTTFTTNLTSGVARVEIPDQINHEIRVGYRWDIN